MDRRSFLGLRRSGGDETDHPLAFTRRGFIGTLIALVCALLGIKLGYRQGATVLAGGSRAAFAASLKRWYAAKWDDHIHDATTIARIVRGKSRQHGWTRTRATMTRYARLTGTPFPGHSRRGGNHDRFGNHRGGPLLRNGASADPLRRLSLWSGGWQSSRAALHATANRISPARDRES